MIHRQLKDLLKLRRVSPKDYEEIAYKQTKLDEDVTGFWPTIENIGRNVGVNISGKLNMMKEIIFDKKVETIFSGISDLVSGGCYINDKYVDEIELEKVMLEEFEQATKPRDNFIQELDRIMIRLDKCFDINKEMTPQQPGGKKSAETDIKNRFTLRENQVLFDNEDLDIGAGIAVEILKALVSNFGAIVPYKIFDENGSQTEASEKTRTAIRRLRKTLKSTEVPVLIKTRKATGYVMLPCDD